MTVYHCELSWLGGDAAVADVAIEVAGDRIASVTAGAARASGAEFLPGLTLPGFANAHSHAFQRALRGRTQGERGTFWTWRAQMYALADRMDPDILFRLARATYAEMALAGVTAVGEFHYLHHAPGGRLYDDPNAMGAALAAAADGAGVRLTLLDTCYLHGDIGVAPDGAQRRFADADAHTWAARADDLTRLASPTCRAGAAVHSVRAVDPASIGIVSAWAAERGSPLHAHVSEQPAENERCRAAHGTTPCGVLAGAGAITPRFTAVHATHLAAEDFARLGSGPATVCLCPTTERDLADGVGPALALRRAGVALALGSDSHAVIDPIEEMRAVEMDERLASRERGGHDAPSLLCAAGANGYASIGWPEGGRLEAGALADFVTVGLDGVRTAGTEPPHALDAAVFAATASDVRTVVTGGRVVVRDGVHTSVDVAVELADAIRGAMGP